MTIDFAAIRAARTSRSRAYHEGPTKSADHYLYRCYDAEGVLLYIGCTVDVKRRIAGHMRAGASPTASWWLAECMVSYQVEGPFKGREAGRTAEREAIRDEHPLFNTQEQRGRGAPYTGTKQRVAEYLVGKGLRSLAIETACTCWAEMRAVGAAAKWCAAHQGLGLPEMDWDKYDEASA